MMTMKEAPRDEIACENTVLHQAGAVQRGSGLLLIDQSDLTVFAANEALVQTYGTIRRLGDVFHAIDEDNVLEDIHANTVGEARYLRLRQGEFVWVRFYETGRYIAVDITYVDETQLADDDTNHKFAQCVGDLSQEHELAMQTHANETAPYFDRLSQGLQALTGFDRVMVYKFDTDLNGEVVSEALSSPEIPAFKGLTFPSGDIPKPARDLFLLNKVRQIIEVNAPADPVVQTDGSNAPVLFDQSHSAFRYTSPVHLEYLTNMDVTATLTIGVVVGQKLWGLVSCHHLSGRKQVPANKLTLCHVLSDLASNHIARQIERQRTHASTKTKELLSKVSRANGETQSSEEFEDVITSFKEDLLHILKADGIQFESETANWIVGKLPERSVVRQLDRAAIDWKTAHDRNYIATADLHRFCPDLPREAKPFGGLLHSVSWDKKSCIRVFRRAAEKSSTWAGDPNAKDRYEGVGEDVLHPRNSFTAYLLQSSGCSEVWQESDVQICQDLHSGLRNIEMSFHKSLRERQLRQSNAEMRNALIDADYQAHHDSLTEIANRRGFERFLDGLVTRQKRDNKMWLVHIDVDHFKHINDTAGHLAGDGVLKHIASILNSLAPKSSKAARIGGDEFTITLSADHSEKNVGDLCALITKRLREPFYFEGIEIRISCTFGITSFIAGKDSSGDILGRSDLALYSGKARGRGVFQFFSSSMEDDRNARRILEKDIERAIEADEFVPYFQPQVDAVTKAVVGLEMLSRWYHPTQGVLTPDKYLAVAQSMGVLDSIDRNLFFQAVMLQSKWTEMCGTTMPISVNVTLDRLRSATLIEDLRSIGPDAKGISLELLESIDLSEDDVAFESTLRDLRQTGVGIEIDDFGAGRTSILAVLKVQPDRLKIDKRLIDPIATDRSALNVVKSVIGIGKQLGISAVAEGVETADQVDILTSLQCERIQGYFFGKPQSAAATERLLRAAA